ncbi:CO/xanthine dehydrogenase Mo-binding subunit [Bradyrhizobium elkanii]|nr:CO/xanthine dehydrogenase Mo-binding subunit [Bradyrhizobium elkanii]
MSDVSATMDLRRRDAADKLRGRTRYTIDRYLPGMLHAAVLRAGLPSGRIIRLDTSRAARMPGVRAIVTASDARGMIGIGIADHPLFARDVIRYDGEPLAAVAAVTLAQAQAALAAIDVEIEQLPAILTMAEALAPDARLVHPDWRGYEVLVEGGARAGNVAWEATVVRGDVDAAFARPDVEIVESLYRVGRQEPRGLRAARGRRKLRGRPLPYRDVDAGSLERPQCNRARVGRAGIASARHCAAGRRRLRSQIRSGG